MGTVTVEWCDRLLATLWERVGEAGAAAARTDPGLAAVVARHESEISGWLDGRGLAGSRQSLAGYAAALLAAAQRCGRRLPAEPHRHDWGAAEWYLLRLVALCRMARRDAPGQPGRASR